MCFNKIVLEVNVSYTMPGSSLDFLCSHRRLCSGDRNRDGFPGAVEVLSGLYIGASLDYSPAPHRRLRRPIVIYSYVTRSLFAVCYRRSL